MRKIALSAALVMGLSFPALALQGGSDKFLTDVVKESNLSLLYIGGERMGYEADANIADAIEDIRSLGGGGGEADDDE